MKALSFLIILTATAATARCGAPDTYETAYSSPELKQCAEEYLGLFGQQTDLHLMSVTFGDIPSLGVCVRTNGQGFVTLNATWWPSLGKCGQKALVFHELSHCLGGKDDVAGDRELMSATPILDNAHWRKVLNAMGVYCD
jgi:hypothetical protein